ncbi:hypothetical protein AGMMS49975_25900 [Clostridia bacterium]|nr:hypothetical protein AGMMS49975_25900 [Clostridia bacterium]
MKIEDWNGKSIRFVEYEDEWWAVAQDIAFALDYRDAYNLTRLLDDTEKGTHKVSTHGGVQDMSIISEFGIYSAIISSNKPEAKEFKNWVKQVIKELRKASGLEGFQVFRLLDKEHQKQCMTLLHDNLQQATKRDYIKANTIADKAVSTMYGFLKMLKKEDMTENMLQDRERFLEEAVEIEVFKRKYGVEMSTSKAVYSGIKAV